MSAFKESAKRHWRDRKTGLLGPVRVPEWPNEDGSAAQLFARPLTAQERFRVRALLAADSKTSDAELLIILARDVEGKKIWTQPERNEIADNYDPQVVGAAAIDLLRLLGEMSEDQEEETDQDVAKNC